MFDIVLCEKPADEGLTKDEIINMIDVLNDDKFLLLEIEAKHVESVAMGVITIEAANKYNYDYSKNGLVDFIANILDDMDNESANEQYIHNGCSIWLTR